MHLLRMLKYSNCCSILVYSVRTCSECLSICNVVPYWGKLYALAQNASVYALLFHTGAFCTHLLRVPQYMQWCSILGILYALAQSASV